MPEKNVVSFTTMIDGYAKYGDMASARFLFDQAPNKDIVAWSALISGYAQNGQPNEAVKIFLQMSTRNVKPDEFIMVSLMSACSQVAYDLIQSMPVEPHAGAWGALLGACKLNGNIELGELVANRLFEIEPLNPVSSPQDVNDVLVAIDHVIDFGLASPSKPAVLGGSHGGFLTTHLIGQAQDKFIAAAARNPVCDLALMVGTTDIPDWRYVEAYGSEGQNSFTDAHVSKVKTPTLFLLGAQDLRVPVSTGLQYARALKEKGVPIKVIVFPNDTHAIERPQSDFESFLSIGVVFKNTNFSCNAGFSEVAFDINKLDKLVSLMTGGNSLSPSLQEPPTDCEIGNLELLEILCKASGKVDVLMHMSGKQ
ncbi:acylamino-acid-releasing enzyme [Prunus yedoensis var. nudiflora]|uniref:Acylamino-acid-releasing enzyme n=1 Tax=Prunus yedoensis var. nudiflora TaxID=2094558 RepID=A0A314Z6P7_PRUYE|nr:acylamino-acid-releasing enzyme [Prunus yedoensis var. nudiflora]